MSFDIPSDSDNDVPDWLQGLQPEEDAADFQPEPAEAPSWMEEDEGSDDAPVNGAEEVPEWLANIRQQESPKEEDEMPPQDTGSLSPEDKKDTANWLEKIRVQYARDTGQLEMPGEEGEAEHEEDDFIERVQALKAKDQATESQAEEDDWLGGLMGEEVEAPEPTADDSGWDLHLDEDSEAEIPAGIWEVDSPQDEAADEGPDWLSGLPSIDTGDLFDEEERPADDEEGMPSWLQGMRPDSDTRPPEVPTFTTDDEEAPDWLEGLPTDEAAETEAYEASPEDTAASADAVDQEFPDLPGEPGEGALPNWLENLKFSPDESKPGVSEEPVLAEDYSAEDVSSLLFEADDLPDWLSEEADQQPEGIAPEAAPPPPAPFDDDEIAPAELPSWLQAMRPIEAAAETTVSEERAEPVELGDKERFGPLAGLADVLPAEPHIVHFGARTLPVTGFELSQAQKAYTRILKSMVDGEAEAPPVSRRKVAIPQQMLRWIIAILIMLVVFFGSLVGPSFIPFPESEMPPAQRAAYNQISSLSQDSHVLVAFEYQPGFSGEMEAAAFAVIDHMLQRGAKISLISTQATGPDIAERFLSAKMGKYPYITEERYANLGYISGGAAGLLNFATNPRDAITLVDANGFSLWNQPPLDTIRKITDYTMVMVITEDPDVARTWVEQVQPLLDPQRDGANTPLIMVVSAQAEPLVYPFYETNPQQIYGLISGIVGGVYYENAAARTPGEPGNAQYAWSVYNISILVAISLIGGISLINLFGVMFRSLRKSARRGSA